MRHDFALSDGQADIYGGHESVPATFVVPDTHMRNADSTMLPGRG